MGRATVETFCDVGTYEDRASHLAEGKPSKFISDCSDVHLDRMARSLKQLGYRTIALVDRAYAVGGSNLLVTQTVEASR